MKQNKLNKEQILNISNSSSGFWLHKYKWSQDYLRPIIKRLVKSGEIKKSFENREFIVYNYNGDKNENKC